MHRRRRQRARAGGGKKAAGEGADLLMECEENPDQVDCLVQKYMTKCKVESSTDSESDHNQNSGSHLSSHGAGRLPEKGELLKLQFLDPYDGDSEETSALSDSGTLDHFLSENDSSISATNDSAVTMECGSSPDPPAPCTDTHCWASPKMADFCSRSPTTPQSLKVRPGLGTAGTACPSDISMDSGVAVEALSPDVGRFVALGFSPIMTNSASSMFPASLTSEENSDFGVIDSSVMKRKFGVKMETEKLRRKKARVAEHSV